MTDNALLPELTRLCDDALAALAPVHHAAETAMRESVTVDGKIDASALDENQYAAHGFAWFSTYVTALKQMKAWADRLETQGKFGTLEQLILQAAFGEYLAQIQGGIPMSQGEFIRLSTLGVPADVIAALGDSRAVATLTGSGNNDATRRAIADQIKDSLDTGRFGETGLEDETLDMVRDQFRRFVNEKVSPHAHGWHERDELIPIEIINEMSELGVFGLTIPEEYGGLGMGKTAMCVVTEELSRGYIGVGSLGTRSEIAAELIRLGGTDAQKEHYLPKLASGEILPTAVFTEPNNGSDLAHLRTRATKDGDTYKVTGNKTWITHAARSDLMTLLARTNPDETGYRGLSMLLAEKPRGTENDPFPAKGMSGGEIEVLGYRGMKEYELSFDGFEVPAENLLGGDEGQGFKQLMATFESARIQTAARAVGVAQNALEIGMRYAQDRIQFSNPLYSFPRVYGKIAWMVVETMIARQLTYFSAIEKDQDIRCDIEAGMAKLLGARVAWSNADNALQIHGGNGYALEYQISRVLCDARILNIFEGAAEIQAQVVTRGLLGR
ncbi:MULTISPECIES: acyl-CoA dehydrogenase family protein [Thalassospira]|uniref:acyl-CoA dehydrogenase family protein n=2 Tax=Thalassospiraceae TaxID=2844866 RepID=UPI00080F78A9|nr:MULTISPECIES: acyl-CoA dehydrogenase family protein [Thalassospira]MAB32803.1 acyl-CoA dehydrogenase [Thalassospira sp.]MBA06000.1 acyl-CoA dehydrogenase [Thalassospira sp.]MDM7974739.1 acyl-CoA dehydrogenase family protein [Thalassospira xiamenensis]OHZ02514.1 acyl-CoA dehydrogenase [Thalassospira sp. MIT1004]QPL38148.1 acyl-CoA/acyl-ACP dehydrogenase [Thalassospira sp. B30-1]